MAQLEQPLTVELMKQMIETLSVQLALPPIPVIHESRFIDYGKNYEFIDPVTKTRYIIVGTMLPPAKWPNRRRRRAIQKARKLRYHAVR